MDGSARTISVLFCRGQANSLFLVSQTAYANPDTLSLFQTKSLTPIKRSGVKCETSSVSAGENVDQQGQQHEESAQDTANADQAALYAAPAEEVTA